MAKKPLTAEQALDALWENYQGSKADLARAIGVKPPALTSWTRVPAERVRPVSEFTGIPPHLLRPDLFDAPV